MNSKVKINLVTPVHSTEFLVRHATQEALVCTGQSNIQAARREHASMLRAAVIYEPSDAELSTKIAIMDNEITKGDYDLANDTPIDMSES